MQQYTLQWQYIKEALLCSKSFISTLKAVSVSIILLTLSSLMVSVKAGQGEVWGNLERLENSG